MQNQPTKMLRIVALLFLASATVNLFVAYQWALAWIDSQTRPVAAQSQLSLTAGGIPASGVASEPPPSPSPSLEAQTQRIEIPFLALPIILSEHIPETPTAAPTLAPTETPQPTFPASFPGAEEVNGVPVDQIVVLNEAVMRRAREIYQHGLELGNRPEAFSKIGDSTIETPLFLSRFDEGPYQLGEYEYLADVIGHYAGSFSRDSAAVRIGLHSWTAMDPMWSDKSICSSGESPVVCELRLQRPSVVIIRVGANDQVGGGYFRGHVEAILNYVIEQGVVPILSTRPYPGGGDANNQVLHQLAEDYDVPLWDFERVAATLPGAGLEGDAVHLTSFYAHDYTLPEALRRGHGLQNLTALIALDRVWRVLQ